MTFFLPVVPLLVVLVFSLIITRVATIALRLTGLSHESAKFQARSAFTGVGFTTTESESIVNHPVRRRIVMILMLLGNVGIATVIATLIVTILGTSESGNWGFDLLFFFSGLLMVWLIANSRWVEGRLNHVIAWALKRFTQLDVRDYVSLLELANGFTVSEIQVEPGDWIANKSLLELGLAREGLLILGIRHRNGDYLGAPSGDSRIVELDSVVVYGPLHRINELDNRRAGDEGDMAHDRACREYDDYLEQVNSSASEPEATAE